jgi:Subtilase family
VRWSSAGLSHRDAKKLGDVSAGQRDRAGAARRLADRDLLGIVFAPIRTARMPSRPASRRAQHRSDDIAVANISLEFPGADDGRCGLTNEDPLHLAICKSVAAGVTYVGSTGNESADLATQVPPSYDEVLAVTSMADFDGKPGGKAAPLCYGFDYGPLGYADDAAAPFSNFAVAPRDRLHTIAAPGACMETTLPRRQVSVSTLPSRAPAPPLPRRPGLWRSASRTEGAAPVSRPATSSRCLRTAPSTMCSTPATGTVGTPSDRRRVGTTGSS